MQNEFKEYADKLRFFIGDVRDRERLKRAFVGGNEKLIGNQLGSPVKIYRINRLVRGKGTERD